MKDLYKLLDVWDSKYWNELDLNIKYQELSIDNWYSKNIIQLITELEESEVKE